MVWKAYLVRDGLLIDIRLQASTTSILRGALSLSEDYDGGESFAFREWDGEAFTGAVEEWRKAW